MNQPSSQTLLSLAALAIMGSLAAAMVFHAVPGGNHDYLVFCLGALAGAMTVAAGNRPPSNPPSGPA